MSVFSTNSFGYSVSYIFYASPYSYFLIHTLSHPSSFYQFYNYFSLLCTWNCFIYYSTCSSSRKCSGYSSILLFISFISISFLASSHFSFRINSSISWIYFLSWFIEKSIDLICSVCSFNAIFSYFCFSVRKLILISKVLGETGCFLKISLTKLFIFSCLLSRTCSLRLIICWKSSNLGDLGLKGNFYLIWLGLLLLLRLLLLLMEL